MSETTRPATVHQQALRSLDLIVDDVYAPPPGATIASEPLNQIFGVGNAGGFRIKGRQPDDVRLIVLYTSGHNPDWPDALDPGTGDFTYYGDNRTPGRGLHDTAKGGNRLVRTIFERSASRRKSAPRFRRSSCSRRPAPAERCAFAGCSHRAHRA